MSPRELPADVLDRRALVYVRQSSTAQVENNVESTRRQYELVDLARAHGFRDVVVIDEDLGRSASGTTDRPGFREVAAQLCSGVVGAVFSLEASRLARNGREWHHLLELCGLMNAYVVDNDGCYNPGDPNDRLLLGLKGTMSEFELTLLRSRMREGALAKARRGELRVTVPVGYEWTDLGLIIDPDKRVQEAVRSVFRLFRRLGSARQVTIHMQRESIAFPSPIKVASSRTWRVPCADTVLGVLKNPFYAGAYAYGKTKTVTKLEEGLVRKTAGHQRRREDWVVLLRDHHDAYVSWEDFELNQDKLARNTYCKRAGAAKSGRGGRALLSGLLRCRRCGRMLSVSYAGGVAARYVCRSQDAGRSATSLCIGVGIRRPDEVIAREVLLAVQPAAVEAAFVAQEQIRERVDEKRRALELEVQQAEYDVSLAARRYEAVDPENRLVAAELEARWNTSLTRLRECRARLEVPEAPMPSVSASLDSLLRLADDLDTVWNAPSTDMRTRQRLVRALINEIVIDVDSEASEIQMIIHWRGGQHSEVRVPKLRAGEHGKETSAEAGQIIREMANRLPDAEIARTLNRMGLRSGAGNSWTKSRVQSYRIKHHITKYESSVKNGEYLTMNEAAAKLGVTSHVIRKLIDGGTLPARQVVYDAPWQIRASDLEMPEVLEAVGTRRRRRGRPCRIFGDDRTLRIPGT